jgi:hypothetical protein
MTVQNGTIKENATALPPTGGTDINYVVDGPPLLNGVHVANMATEDFRVRENITFKVVQPKYNGSTYSKGKIAFTMVIPFLLADGTTSFQLFRGEREIHPEFSAADAKDILFQSAQIMTSSDYEALWSGGSTA